MCPICFNAKHLDPATLIKGATVGGTVPLWEWIGDEGGHDIQLLSGVEEPDDTPTRRLTSWRFGDMNACSDWPRDGWQCRRRGFAKKRG